MVRRTHPSCSYFFGTVNPYRRSVVCSGKTTVSFPLFLPPKPYPSLWCSCTSIELLPADYVAGGVQHCGTLRATICSCDPFPSNSEDDNDTQSVSRERDEPSRAASPCYCWKKDFESAKLSDFTCLLLAVAPLFLFLYCSVLSLSSLPF